MFGFADHSKCALRIDFQLVQRQVDTLRSDVDTLQASQRALKLEWEMAFDKLATLIARLNVRAKRDLGETKTDEDAPGRENGGGGATHGRGRIGPWPTVNR